MTPISVLIDIPGGGFEHTMGQGLVGHRIHRTCQMHGCSLVSPLAKGGGHVLITFLCLSGRVRPFTSVRGTVAGTLGMLHSGT